MVPTPNQIAEALTRKKISFDCRSCGNQQSFKIHGAGVNITELGNAATNSMVSTARWVPMAMLSCGMCGETRFYQMEWLGFAPPY